jgi:hypothetical protein
MPKTETSNSNNGPAYQTPRYRPNWVSAVICFILGTLLMVALVDYTPNQSSLATTHPTSTNLVGLWGANGIWILLYTIGLSVWLVPVFVLWLLYVSVRNARRLAGTRLVAMVISITSLAGLVAMFESFGSSDYFPQGPGGWLGGLVFKHGLRDTLGVFGAGLLFGTVYLCGLMFIFTKDIGAEFERYVANFHAWREERTKRKAALAEERAKERELMQKQKTADATKTAAAAAPPPPPSPTVGPLAGKKLVIPTSKEDPLSRVELNIVKPEETKKAKVTALPQSDDANYEFPPLTPLKEQVRPSAEQQRGGAPANAREPAAHSGRVRRRGDAGRDPRRPGHHALRGRPGPRRARGKDRRPRQEHRPRHARPVGAHPRPDSRQGRGRRRGAQPAPHPGRHARDHRERRLGLGQGRAPDRARQGRFRQAAHLRPDQDAPPADRRRDGLRQIGVHQLHRRLDPLLEEPEGRPADHGGPQGRRAEGLQHAPAHAHPGGDRAEEGPRCAQVAARRDGAALPDVREVQRPQHRRLQRPQERAPSPTPPVEQQAKLAGVDPARDDIEPCPTACPTSSRSSTNWPT